MPKQKDLKRIVRTRMRKTGESYTAARLHTLKRQRPVAHYAETAGHTDAVVKRATGRDWTEWVRILDAAKAATKPHREIAQYVSSKGAPDWWSQTVAVGYERIRGLRDRGQRLDGTYEASKSRTFAVGVGELFDAFVKPRRRARWLPDKISVRTANRPKTMRFTMPDGTIVVLGFTAKGKGKSAVALLHSKLADKSAAERVKASWAARLDTLGELLA